MFKQLDEDEAMTVENGVYKLAKVYEGPDGGLFVSSKGGFVRVKNNGGTSHASVRVEHLQREGALFQDTFGRLCVSGGKGRRPVAIAADDTFRLENKI